MPKFESPIKISSIKSLSGNTTLLHLGDDNRVGVLTDAPESELHVDGTITATGLVVPPSIISAQGDSATTFGFNPNFTEWNGPPDNSPNVANGYSQTGGGVVQRSSISNLGGFSARFHDNGDVVWSREVPFQSPLYANVFIQGTFTYKFDGWSSGEPGLAVTLTSRPKACTDYTSMTNTFIVPTFSENRSTAKDWQTGTFRAHTPGNREITHLKIEIISTSATTYDSATVGVNNDGGAGNSTILGNEDNIIDYDWYVDGFDFSFMHPDMRVDQQGRITGAHIAAATIDDLHIRDMISSTSSLIKNDAGLSVQGLVANTTHADGWSIAKSGEIKATDIKIYGHDGTVLISGRGDTDGKPNPFAEWRAAEDPANRPSLSDLDPAASTYLYGLAFEESNKTSLLANISYLATSGLDSDTFSANDHSIHFANVVSGAAGADGTDLANGFITFNGITTNAPPGSIYTSTDATIIRNQDAYILFLANTQKWDTNIGAQQKYHANTLLGEFGLYVLATPTVGGWLYHPHGNSTWYTIDSTQSGNDLHENDFLVIGRIGTDPTGKIRADKTYLQPPKNPDSITIPERTGTFAPIGITAGGVLFADIHLNQWNHTANAGEIQFTNRRNSPNTRFAFIHPGTDDPADSIIYTTNGAYGVLTSLEDFPGSRYITFIGADQSRFTLQTGHSPDFVAAFPIGDKWFYNQDEGKFAEFTPDGRDCIVARVDSNGSAVSAFPSDSSALTNIYRYAERETITAEGATLSELIIDPPRGMASGGLVFAELTVNKEFKQSDDTFVSNAGFIAITNSINDPKNEFYVIHPTNGNNWLVDTVGRGVVTSLKPTVNAYGTRHIAFVGTDTTRFALPSDAYENVSNSFVAVLENDSQGHPRADGKWYYDNGANVSSTFTPDANDFIIATINSFDPDSDGIDQITQWSAPEGQIIVDGVTTTITSLRNLLNSRIDSTNAAVTFAIDSAANAYANAVTAQGTAADASANAAQALGLLDGAITVYFEEEGGHFVNAVGTGGYGYNDLWINVSPYNEFIDGSWSSNAIFRYANTFGGFDSPLVWMHDSENLQGRAYLASLTARQFADRATTIYYMDRINSSAPFYGPNVAILTVSGPDLAAGKIRLNTNPEGDFWYDTTDDAIEFNRPYVYKTNTSFSTSNAYGLSLQPPVSGYANGIGTTGEWSQTAYIDADFNPALSPTGWYDIRDTAISTATDQAARDSAANALAQAANAQFAADRQILAFFQVESDVPTATGNGDVWIHTDNAIKTDGTKNTGAIFVANTKPSGSYNAGVDPTGFQNYWYEAPNNAIGLMYLHSYSAGVSGEFEHGTNIMPRGYSLFDAPASDYEFSTPSVPNTRETEAPYFFGQAPANAGAGKGFANLYIDSSGYVGSNSLFVRGVDSSWHRAGSILSLGDVDPSTWLSDLNTFGIDIPKGKKWIFSWHWKTSNLYVSSDADVANRTANLGVGFRVGNSTHAGSWVEASSDMWGSINPQKNPKEKDVWQRDYHVLDFTSPDSYDDPGDGEGIIPANEITKIHPVFVLKRVDIAGDPNWLVNREQHYNIDAVQLEEVPNTVFTPSQFKEPSDDSAIVFGREITDGKIVTHYYDSGTSGYGPVPNTTPTGYPNPQPHGDFWVDTGNNNIIFRYHQQNPLNGVIPSAQTIHWTAETNGDGWYTTEDLRTGNALSTSYDALANAATAQAAADREIVAFFQTDVPEATGNGDVWIDTDSFATLNTSSIYVAFSKGATATAASPAPDKWYPSPTSAIGQVYLNAYLAERKASRNESFVLGVTGSGDLPFPVYPDANGIYVGATGNLAFYKNSKTEYLIDQPTTDDQGRIFVSNRGGIDLVGPNGKIWYPYSNDFGIPEEGVVETKYRVGNPGWVTDSNTSFSSLYLMYTNMNASARFAGSSIPNFGKHDHIIPVRWNNVDGQRQWEAVVFTSGTFIDFIPDAANGDFLVAKLTRPTEVPEGFATLDSWVFKTLPVQTQAISDGKIVTHFGPHSPPDTGTHGPQANLTPTGLANPEPHGDFWINTSNNNLVFRYHSNTLNKSAQTAYHAPLKPETNADKAGWYSTEDPRAQTAYATSYQALADAASALANAATAQAAADREILAFFADEADNPTTTTGNGDIWIVTDHLVIPGTSVANTRSIRVANTLGGGPAAGGSGTRFWHEAPNNAIGLNYLKNYATGYDLRKITDGKIVTHFYDTEQSGPWTHGPQANVTPTGLLNPEPHGDFLIDTGNNNIMYRYHQKIPSARAFDASDSTFAQTLNFFTPTSTSGDGWYSIVDPRIANNEQYASNTQVWLANTDAWARTIQADLHPGGNTFLYINFALANAHYANGVAYNANAAAYLAQAAADREILAFFTLSTDTVPVATGNGDVWIHTDTLIKLSDGTLNTSAIFVANTKTGGDYDDGNHRWWKSPNNAIGLMYARSYAAGIGGQFATGSNWWPRGYSTFDAPASDYSNTTTTIGEVAYPFRRPNVDVDIVVDGTSPVGGNDKVLRLKKTVDSAHVDWSSQSEDNYHNDPTVIIPKGKKWIFSWYARIDTLYSGNKLYSGFFVQPANSSGFGNPIYSTYIGENDARGDSLRPFTTTDWERHWINIDLTDAANTLNSHSDGTRHWYRESGVEWDEMNNIYANTVDRFILRVDPGGWNGTNPSSDGYGSGDIVGNTVYYTGFQLEEVPADRNLPTDFKEPSDDKAIVFGRTITDGKVVTQFYDTSQSNYTHGPVANVTPTGYPNPEPHGDMFVDTGNNNVMYRYHQKIPSARAFDADNSTFAQTLNFFAPIAGSSEDGWYSMDDPRIANAQIYTSNLHVWLANTHNWASSLEGNTVNNQIWTNFALANAYSANGVAYNANAAAYLAQAAADREINAFFSPYASPGPNATGNGDVWIHTDNLIKSDGTLNAAAIHVANTMSGGITDGDEHRWHTSPYNAIGLMYARSYANGVGGSFDRGTNIMPRGYSLFDQPITDYKPRSADEALSSTDESLSPGELPIKEPYPFYWEKADDGSGNFDLANVAIDHTGNGYIGATSSLRVTKQRTNDAGDEYIVFGVDNAHGSQDRAETNNPYAINIPKGKKWIFSYYVKANTADQTTTYPKFYMGNTTHYNAGWINIFPEKDIITADTWQRNEWVLDLTSGSTDSQGGETGSSPKAEVTKLNVLLFSTASSSQGVDYYYDAIQLEEVPADVFTASQFKEPSDSSAIVFGRTITDGKIVTHYFTDASGAGNGPIPNTTPLGLPNPEPHGDFWVDTGNNFVMFRYHHEDTGSIPFAQTATFGCTSPSADGWYAMEDPRTSNALVTAHAANVTAQEALQRAVTAASAADAEILVFFEPSTNATMREDPYSYGSNVGPATGNGDIWIQIDQVYDADGNQNTGSIFFANLSPGIGWTQSTESAIGRSFLEQFTSVGVKNWFPSGYSTWDEPSSDYLISDTDSDFNADTPYPLRGLNKANTVVNTSFGKVSSGSLQVTTGDVNQTSSLVYFANNRVGSASLNKTVFKAGPPSITHQFPKGKRWIYSYYAYTNSPTAFFEYPVVSQSIVFDDTDDPNSNLVNFKTHEYISKGENYINKWRRFSHVFDFSNTHIHANASSYTDKYPGTSRPNQFLGDPTNRPQSRNTIGLDGSAHTEDNSHHARLANLNSASITLYIYANTGSNGGNTVWLDGFQWEEAPGEQMLPGPFSDPDRRRSSHFSQSIADGKIVTHYMPGTGTNPYYGPRPHVTPSGVTNPTPHGDFWVDTANNNALYRFSANNSYVFKTSDVDDVAHGAQTAYWSTVGVENNKTGWYSIQDGRIGILTTNVTSAFGDLASQLTRIVEIEATTDGELQVFFEPEGGNFGNAVNTYVGSSYGDIWINTDEYNKFANGTLSSNAIFRWQNSVSGFAEYILDLESGTNAPKGLAWRHSPNSAIGQVYLQTYAAQNAADQRVTAYFMGGFGTGAGYRGPQTNTTPTGRYNANPDGDIWIDTSNNNIMYVYNYVDGVHSVGFAQTIIYSPTSTEEGWHSAEDLRIGATKLAQELVQATGSDRHVQIFYAADNPTTSTGNGDIWIDTTAPLKQDGTANTLSIFVANTTDGGYGAADGSSTRFWNLDETSAIGRSALDGYNADQKSAQSELMSLIIAGTTRTAGAQGTRESSIPFPVYPEANGIMGVGATGNVSFYPNANTKTLEYIVGTTNSDGFEDNAQGEFAILNEGGVLFIGPDGIEREISSINTSLPATVLGTRWEGAAVMSEANTNYIMYTNMSASDRWGPTHGNRNFVNVEWASEAKTWYARPNSGSVTGPGGFAGNTFIPDAANGDFLVGRFYKDASTTGITRFDSWIFDSLPAQTRKYSDGKTVYFVSNAFHGATEDHRWGPNPSVTETGLANPEPFGDKWLSLSPPYKSYLYFSNATNKTSQTAYHLPGSTPPTGGAFANTHWPFSLTGNNDSGWYEYRDTGDALTQQGFQVALGQVAIEQASWTEGGQTVIEGITFDGPTDGSQGPPVVVTNETEFGPTKELLLNPVPPPDQNLHGHWTFNSFSVDSFANRFVADVSGRKNHAKAPYGFTDGQSCFRDHDPASDVINISGNHSLFSDGVNGDPGLARSGDVILAVHGSTYQNTAPDGSKYPLDISDTTLYNKQTWTFWYKPSDEVDNGDELIGRRPQLNFGLQAFGNFDGGPASDEMDLKYFLYPTTGDAGGSQQEQTISSTEDTSHWYGPTGNDDKPLRKNTWHFFTLTHDFVSNKSTLWIYREGDGLIYYRSWDIADEATTADGTQSNTERSVKLIGRGSSPSGDYTMSGAAGDRLGRAGGHLDEARFYNTILTPRNIRYLYMNPTGRPQQLQPRPGMGVKKGFVSFANGNWADGSLVNDKYANTFAYIHGFDVDGNPADVNPYISFDGNVKYLNRGPVKIDFVSDAVAGLYAGNTGYIMYSDTTWDDDDSDGTTGVDPYYVFAQPVGSNTTQPHTWRYHVYEDTGNSPLKAWQYFTPDDSTHLVVGELKLANSVEMSAMSGGTALAELRIDSVSVYQMARKPSIVRESYNFTIRPSDFIGNFVSNDPAGGEHFFANSAWWDSNLLNGTYIAEATIGNAAIIGLHADKISAGTIRAGVHVGGEAKVLIDGVNSRIVISD